MNKYRSQNDGLEREFSDLASHVPVGASLTLQSQAEDADINVIMKRFKVTGQLPVNQRLPTYGDFSGVTDYASALACVMQAEDDFMAWPAEIRARFENSPQKFLDFVSQESNMPEMVKLGLAKEKVDVSVGKVGGNVAGEVRSAAGGSSGDAKVA